MARRIPLIFFLLVPLVLIGCEGPKNNTVPHYLIGTWRSQAPGYTDRFLHFTQHGVMFGTGGDSGEAFPVSEVQEFTVTDVASARYKNSVLFTIHYITNERQEYLLSFYYDPAPEGAITFKNQEQVRWTKERS